MGVSGAQLGVTLTAKDLASAKFEGVRGQLLKTGKAGKKLAAEWDRNMKQMKAGAVRMGVGIGVLAGINSVSKDFGKFEFTLVSAGQIMGATTKEMKNLENAAIQAGIATQFSPAEAAKGLENLGAAGLKSASAIKALNPVLNLAAASLGQLGVAEAASVATGVLNAFGETTDKLALRVDQLVKITQLSNFQARDFSVAIGQASAQAKSANQSFESMLAVFGLLRNASVSASVAATSYREAVRRVAGDTQALAALTKLGITTIDSQTGGIKDLGRIIAELAPRMRGMNANQKNLNLKVIFGVRGMKVFNAFMSSYSKAVKEGRVQAGDFAGAQKLLIGGLKGATGAAGRTRDALLKTAEGQRLLLKGSLETFKIMLGQTLTPVLLPAIKSITSALNFFIKLIKSIPAPIKNIFANFAGMAATFVALSGAVKILGAAFGLLRLTKLAANLGDADKAGKGLGDTLGKGGKGVSRFGRALGGLGRALPFIGLGIAAVVSVVGVINKDADEIEKSRKARMNALERQLKQAKVTFGEVQAAAEAARDAALKSATALVKQGEGTRKVAKKSLLEFQKIFAKNLKASFKATVRLINVQERLKRVKNTRIAASLRAEEADLLNTIATSSARLKVFKTQELVLKGIEAQRTLRTEKNATKRKKLTGAAVAGRLIQERRMNVNIKKLEGSRAESQRDGLDKLVKVQDKALAKQRSQLARHRKRTLKIAGITETDVAKQRKGLRRVAGATLGEARAFGGPELETFRESIASLTLPSGIKSRSQLLRLQRLAETTITGGVGQQLGIVTGEFGPRRQEAITFIDQLRNLVADPPEFGAGAAAGPTGVPRPVGVGGGGRERQLQVTINLDGQKLGEILAGQSIEAQAQEGAALVSPLGGITGVSGGIATAVGIL